MNRRLHLFQVVAALFAGVFGLSPVASSFHADDHAHVYCAEHQAIEESSALASVAVSAPAFDFAQSASLAFDFAQAERMEHESCPFLELTVRSATSAQRGLVDDVVESGEAVTASLLRGHCVVAVLFTAPKASPPQA